MGATSDNTFSRPDWAIGEDAFMYLFLLPFPACTYSMGTQQVTLFAAEAQSGTIKLAVRAHRPAFKSATKNISTLRLQVA